MKLLAAHPITFFITLMFLHVITTSANTNPFDVDMQDKIRVLRNTTNESSLHERARAAEALGYMRAYDAEDALIAALSDTAADVRRSVVLSLAWCGSRPALKPLSQTLNDSDWTVRQSAATALENLTGMSIKFDALENAAARKLVVAQWENYINSLPVNTIPDDILTLITSTDHCVAARGLRAAGALGLDVSTVELIAGTLETWRKTSNEKDADAKIRVQSAIRALGRSGVPEAFPVLRDFLRNPQWTRYAADALGDFGGDDAASVLMDVFPSHARQITDNALNREITIKAQATHPSDVPHLDARDRVLAAPYAILFSLSRIQFNDPQLTIRLKQLAPLIVQQIPLDIDRLVFYEEEPFQKIFRSLLIRAGEKENLLQHAFISLDVTNVGNDVDKNVRDNVKNLDLPTHAVASPVLRGGDEPFHITCDVNGWNDIYLVVDCVENYSMDRANWADAKLTDTASETVYLDTLKPVSAEQQHDTLKLDVDDRDSVTLLVRLLNDEMNSLGISHRAALALDKIGSPESLTALREAERNHPYHSVRIAAREALWRHNVSPLPELPAPDVVAPVVAQSDIPRRATRFVFIKGDIVPDNNPFQMDSWRQAYMTTDSGPTYRPGRNLFVLDISDGKPVVQQLTNFNDGYVADCEVSYDGKTVWFSRREQTSPWWHVFRLNLTPQADGSNVPNLQQVTRGAYHDVQPVELPDGRIAFSSSRLGTRDEYHGYLATGLSTMTPDGRDIQVVGFNFGRDAEPAVAGDGRILITRLELFYSRMKTEFNLIALRSDGTQAQTIYGPERRAFWRQIHGGYGNWFAGGEEGGRHRLLRLTQPQPFSTDNVLLTTPAGPVLT